MKLKQTLLKSLFFCGQIVRNYRIYSYSFLGRYREKKSCEGRIALTLIGTITIIQRLEPHRQLRLFLL